MTEPNAGNSKAPVVFMHQPSRFDLVPTDKLHEWEQRVRDDVGLPVEFARNGGGSECLSATLPNDCMEDCDYLAE